MLFNISQIPQGQDGPGTIGDEGLTLQPAPDQAIHTPGMEGKPFRGKGPFKQDIGIVMHYHEAR